MDLVKFDKWENMFSKEYVVFVLTDLLTSCESKSRKGLGKEQIFSGNNMVKEDIVNEKESQENQKQQDFYGVMETIGFVFWQDGVLERLKTVVDVKDYNMYLVYNGRMFIYFGQMVVCIFKERDFVYGNLEVQEVKIVYIFKVFVSYCGKRVRFGDVMLSCRLGEYKVVDILDLGIIVEDLFKLDFIKIIFLCVLEREFKGYVIFEFRSIDGLFMDFVIQIYNFESEQFFFGTVLVDFLIIVESGGFYVEFYSEFVIRRYNKSSFVFIFICNKFFRRDEFFLYFKNVYIDIQLCFNGWFQYRCFFVYLGCIFI